MRSLRLAVAGRLSQNVRESDASRVPDRLLLALVLMCTHSLYSTRAPALRPRRHRLVGVRGPPHTLLQAQHRFAMANRTRGQVLAEVGMSCGSWRTS
jgi:hypothetical protein